MTANSTNNEWKVLPSQRPRTPWLVQYRAHLWFFKTQAEAQAFADKNNSGSK